ncbi:MAG: YdcF family protein [Pseudolabrys sp.]
MFFILSKTAVFFLLPSNFIIALGIAGVVLLFTRFARAGKYMAVASIVLLMLAGFLPIGRLLTHPLEQRFPPWDASRGAPDGIIVLGGVINPRLTRHYGETAVNADVARLVALAKLARAFPNARIVFTSGDSSLTASEEAEADYLYPLLDDFGIPRSRVQLEPRARNTFENAVFSKELMQPKPGERWLLVTSARHMPRSMGSFRRVGFPVEAYPVGWSSPRRNSLAPLDTLSAGLAALDRGSREWIGLIAYWLAGNSSELFPKP